MRMSQIGQKRSVTNDCCWRLTPSRVWPAVTAGPPAAIGASPNTARRAPGGGPETTGEDDLCVGFTARLASDPAAPRQLP